MKDLLVVGSGITGALTAALLSRAVPGLSLTVWDKARGAGGRMSTHRDPGHAALHVDMGAQYISKFRPKPSESAAYRMLKEDTYAELLAGRLLQPFCGAIEGERSDPQNPIEGNYVAPKGMCSIAAYFLSQSRASVAYLQHLKKIDARGNRAYCETTSGVGADFDAVVLTMPVPQILTLQGDVLQQLGACARTNLEAVTYSSRYALGLVFNTDTQSRPKYEWSAKYIDHPIIRFVCWDSSKRGCYSDETGTEHQGETLLVHTSVPFAVEHLEMDKPRIEALIRAMLAEVLPDLPQPQHTHLVCWRYSQVHAPYVDCPGVVELCREPLVLATGDGFVRSNFEGCLYAAHSTMQAIVQ